MTIDIRSRNFRVISYIGTNQSPQNISDAVESITVSYSNIDTSGLLLISGQMILRVAASGFTRSFFDSRQTNRWSRGNKITIEVANESGTLEFIPLGAVRIAKEALPPKSDDETIRIDLCCLLSLLNYRSPDKKEEPDEISQRDRGIVVGEILVEAGIQESINISLPPYPLNVPIFRSGGGYIKQAGELAFAGGWCLFVLCSGGAEQIEARRIAFDVDASYSLIVGQDEKLYEPIQDAELPAEKVIATAVGYESEFIDKDPPDETTITRASISTVFSDVVSDDSIIVETNTTSYSGVASSRPKVTHSRRQLLGLLMSDIFFNNRSLVPSERITETSNYEGGGSCRLLKKTRITRQLKGVVLPDFYPGNTEFCDAKKETWKYDYAGEITEEVTYTLFEPYGIVNPDILSGVVESPPSPETPVLSKTQKDKWRKYGSGWIQTSLVSDYKKGTNGGKASSTQSQTNNQPPAPERKQESSIQKEKLWKGEANFTPRNQGNYSNREREIQLGAGSVVDQGQIDLIAKTYGTILHGRSNGVSFACAITNPWLDYVPMQSIFWSDGNKRYKYLIDGFTIAITPREAIVGADGIWIGTEVTYTPTPQPSPTPSPAPTPVTVILTPFDPGDTFGATTVSSGELNGIDYPIAGGSASFAGTSVSQGILVNGNTFFSATFVSGGVLTSDGGGTPGGGGAEYTGNESTRNITLSLAGETPDWVGVFRKSNGKFTLFDSVRGIGKGVSYSNNDEADSLTAFIVDGFSLGENTGSIDVNKTGVDYMAYALPESSSFDVVTWSGDDDSERAIAHSLGSAPNVILLIRPGDFWLFYHKDFPNAVNDAFEFPSSSPTGFAGAFTALPNSSSFFVSSDFRVNASGQDYVAYLFATTAGTYTGDGTLTNAIAAGEEPTNLWIFSIFNDGETVRAECTIFDATRNPSNPRNKAARLDENTFFGTGEFTDEETVNFNSDGFTPNDHPRVNESGRTYYYFYF